MNELSVNELSHVNGAEGFAISGETVGCAVGGAIGSRIGGYTGGALGCMAGGSLVNGLSSGDQSPNCASTWSTSTCSSSSSGSSRVICTHFFRKGMIEQNIWRADLEFTFKHLSPTVVRGYHVWAIPYVKLMRKSPIAEKIMLPLAKCRAIELAHKMGVVEKGSLRGKMIRAIGEPICFMIGVLAKEQNWESLWSDRPASVTSA